MSGSKSYPTSDASEKPERGEVVLSLKTVHKMLPLVQQIAHDILESHQITDRLRPEEDRLDRQRHSLDWPKRKRRYEVKEEIGKAEKELEIALAELRELGLLLLAGAEGTIGFPTLVNNRRAFFSWHPGDKDLQTWRFADEDVDRPIPVSWLKELSLAGKT
ncbi:MAG: DUF2203 family protein [Planctomycetes bacterium]|nr:DUF2203 family protein [Planctomycetota bacterium]